MVKYEKTIIEPTSLPVVNLVPSMMPLPKVALPVYFNQHPTAVRLFCDIGAGEAPYVFAVMSKPGVEEVPGRFYTTGMVCSTRIGDDGCVLLTGEYRVSATGSFKLKDDPGSYWTVKVMLVQDDNVDDHFVDSHAHKRVLADLIKVKHLLERLYYDGKKFWIFNAAFTEYLLDNFYNFDFGDKDDTDHFLWLVLSAIPEVLQEDKQPFLESTNLLERLNMLIKLLKSQLEILAAYKAGEKNDKSPQNTDGDKKDPKDKKDKDDHLFVKTHTIVKKAWERFKQIREFMNEDAQVVAREDIDRLASYGSPAGNSYEWPKFKRRLDFLLDLPWNSETEPESDISKVAQVLDEDHYGLTHVKDKICDGIAPKILNPTGKSQIICLVGPPGVGKTSLAKSVARALNRNLIRMSLGGIRDESQIRGHDVTYIGSQPGEILREIKRCGTKNPVFVIDEIDKVGRQSTAGDPSSAMLEVLDPEQNYSFKDHYLGCSFDLSKVLFIATANIESTIIPALRDRMDIIRLPGYLEMEKIEIARQYLIPRWLQDTGLEKAGVKTEWTEDTLPFLIGSYTEEAGVRNLERNIATIFRRLARRYLESSKRGSPMREFKVTKELITNLLGPEKYSQEGIRPTDIGEAVGLAWTSVGGVITYVQTKQIPRVKEQFTFSQTGLQGKVMNEANKVALTLVRDKNGNNPEAVSFFENNSIHLHIPEGATPKDGPSAGITAFIALHSLVNKKPVKQGVAMTGEVNLSGRVTEVGGIREKVYAAERVGVREVILPKGNQRNLFDVPKEVKERLQFHFVETTDDVLNIVF